MKRLAFVVLALLALPAVAQEATINTPITRSSIAKYKIDMFSFQRSAPALLIDVVSQDSSNVDIAVTRYAIPTAAGVPGPSGVACTNATSISGLAGAMNAARSGETGSEQRKQQFRQLGYLSDQGCLGTVTLVP